MLADIPREHIDFFSILFVLVKNGFIYQISLMSEAIKTDELVEYIKEAKRIIDFQKAEGNIIDSVKVYDEKTCEKMYKAINAVSFWDDQKHNVLSHICGIPIRINPLMPKNSFWFFSWLKPIKIFVFSEESEKRDQEPHQEFCHYCRMFMPHERIVENGKRYSRCQVCERKK